MVYCEVPIPFKPINHLLFELRWDVDKSIDGLEKLQNHPKRTQARTRMISVNVIIVQFTITND